MIKYLFCHGFGFDRKYWQNFYPLLTKGEVYSLDLGYFNHSSTNDILDKYNDDFSFKVGIAHSLGFSKLINTNITFDIIIGINAFCNFLGNNELYNTRLNEHSALLKQFYVNPILTLKKFYKRCGLDEPINDLTQINTNALTQDLKLLLDRVTCPSNTPILIINSLDDIIVPTAITLNNFLNLNNVDIKLLKNGNHAIILKNPAEVANLINNYTNDHISKANN